MLYELPGDPLGDSADPRRYVPVDTHEQALDALGAGIRDGRSPLLLVGAAGVGKTLLLRVLAQRQRREGHVAVFSPFLHLAPDDVPRWLLHLLGRPAPATGAPDLALLAVLRFQSAHPTVVLVDEIQSAPEPSVRRLVELVQAGGPRLALVAAGAPGARLDALLPALAPKARFELPDALLPHEIDAVCDAILRHPALEPELRALAPREREALLRAASGVPVMLKNALVRRAVCVSVGASSRARETASTWPDWPVASDADVRPKREPRAGLAPWPRRLADAPSERASAAAWRPPAPAAPSEPETVRVAPLSRVTTPVLRRARRAASQIVSEGLDRSAAAGATLAAAARRRLAAGHRAAEAQMRRLLPLLIESGRRAEDLALRTAAWAAPQLEWTRAVAGEAYRDALTGARRGLGRLRVEAARLPHPAIAAAVALLLVAVVPLGDAARVQVAAPTPAAAPPPVRVQVNARPWAQVKVDGIDVGPTPLSHLELAPGPHAFEARFPDGRVLRRRIEIGPAHRFVSLP